LKAGASATTQQIARSLKIAASTVSTRIPRMKELNTMCVVAVVTDFAALGHKVLLTIGLFRTLEEVASLADNRIFALPGARHVETSIAIKTLKLDYRVSKIIAFGKS